MSDWFERMLSKYPAATIVVLASVGTAFLIGTGVLRPVFRFGQKFSRLGFQGNPAVPSNSATPGK